ncbi:MAG: hypothetical protein AAF926_05065 [Pseudomonadota bacterium]
MIMLLQIGGMAVFVSLAVTGFARLGGLGDIPDHRSSHACTTPTAGGLGIIAGIGAGIILAATLYADRFFAQPGSAQKLATLLSLAFAVSFLGLLDDRYVLPSKLKFGLLLVFSAFAADAVGAVTMLPFASDHIYLLWWSGLAGSILWLFTVTNGVNFMDGINGLFGVTMSVASGALCLLALKAGAPVAALLSGTLCAALLGFLPYNLRPRAAVFSGDCGSLGAAFLYAGAVLFLVHEQPELRLLYAGPLLIMPFLADVLLTLLRKPMRGIGLLEPHNTHIYQRWARRRGGHIMVSLIYGGLGLIMAGLVHVSYGNGTLGSLSGLGLMSGLFICLYILRSATLPD